MWFEAISKLRVNMDKSESIPMGRVENVEDLVAELGCKVGSLLSTFLGMSLGAPFNPWQLEMELRDWLCGSDNISLRVENHLDMKRFVQFANLFYVYSPFARSDWNRFKGIFCRKVRL